MSFLLLSAISTALLTLWLSSSRAPLTIIDQPNERSLHKEPVPRTGGLALLLGVLIGWFTYAYQYELPTQMYWIFLASALIVMISLADDFFSLTPQLRFIVHSVAALLLIYGEISLAWNVSFFTQTIAFIVTFLAIVWILNLYNFMDGMDGFAGGMTCFGFCFLGIAGWMHGDNVYASYVWVVSAASLGFLWKNFPPAKIFMGDVGSVTIGLLAAAFSLWGVHSSIFSIWFPLIVFSPFFVDSTITLLRRAINREKVWKAHRKHYYQRLVQAGHSHKRIVLTEYLLMLISGALALLLLKTGLEMTIVMITVVLYICLVVCAEKKSIPF